MAKTDITKFNWKEIFSNNSGKTSGSGFSGVIAIMVGLLGFIASIVMYFITKYAAYAPEISASSVTIIGIGAALLGVRKIWKDKDSIKIGEDSTSTDSESEMLKS